MIASDTFAIMPGCRSQQLTGQADFWNPTGSLKQLIRCDGRVLEPRQDILAQQRGEVTWWSGDQEVVEAFAAEGADHADKLNCIAANSSGRRS